MLDKQNTYVGCVGPANCYSVNSHQVPLSDCQGLERGRTVEGIVRSQREREVGSVTGAASWVKNEKQAA